MNTTVTINLAGIAFYIDEDAYKTLHAYLQSIENNLGEDTDKAEVMKDIEARIAEIFRDALRRDHTEVVSMNLVRAVMEQLGTPEDFKDPADAPSTPAEESSFSKFLQRKVYRDTDHKIIGGVCSGLGHWFNIDAIWLRIIFLLCLLIWGITLPIYLILWLIMPEARTAAQRLDMRGEEPTVENIQREIEYQKEHPARNGGCLLTMLQIFVWLVGAFFFFIAMIVFYALFVGTASLFPLGLIGVFFAHTPWIAVLLAILLVIIIGLPIFGLIYAIVKYFRKGEHISSRAVWLGFFIWLASVIGCTVLGIYEIATNEEVQQALQDPDIYSWDDDDAAPSQSLVLEPFNAVNVHGSAKITLTQAEEQYVTYQATPGNGFSAEVIDNVLVIKSGVNGAKLWIQTPDIESLQFSGAAKCNTQGTIVVDTMSIYVSGAGKLDLDLQANMLDISTSGAGSIDLTGSADHMNIDISGAGKIDANDLMTRIAEVDASGASRVELNVTDSLLLDCSGLCKITYDDTHSPDVQYIGKSVGSKIKRSK